MPEPNPTAATAAAGAPAPPDGPKKRGKSILLIAVGLVVTIGAAGTGAFFYTRRAAAPAAEVHQKASDRGLIKFEPFVANLADPGGSRFVRISVQLVVDSPAKADEAEKAPVLLMRARSKILELLTQQTADTLVTPQGKAELKKAIAEQVKESLDEMQVIDVLFSDFVVQF